MPRTSEVETWETTTNSWVSVNMYDARGMQRSRVFGGHQGQRVMLSQPEREELNEDLATDASVCIFRNGMLRPLRGVPDEVMQRFEQETKRHGGHTTEELVTALEVKPPDEFKAWVDGLNESTLRRLAEIAPAADATASKLAVIDGALERFAITGPDGKAARLTEADRIVRAEPKTPGAPVAT